MPASAVVWIAQRGKGNHMTYRIGRRVALALAVGTMAAAIGGGAALAQDTAGSTISVGGGSTSIFGDGSVADIFGPNGGGLVLPPGVTISGGDVSNATDIGVLGGGGSAIGDSTGGDDSAAVTE